MIAGRSTSTSRALTQALIGGAVWEELTPQDALDVLRPGDGALGRLDVSPTLDGIDDGLWALGALAARGVHVLNDPGALLATDDKLLTARILRRHGLPHPATTHVRDSRMAPPLAGAPRSGEAALRQLGKVRVPLRRLDGPGGDAGRHQP